MQIVLEVSGVRRANSEASPHALFPFRPFHVTISHFTLKMNSPLESP
jgi:hypothetical protein